ncbi:MAG: radical SAM/SPASM domain-containing protein [Candidatus Aenigmarchaeota archaeon]|nr:radical SAM/SPASM domain-containing protein [Candidatus Aenigmarchaeota archaeon]
MIPEYSRLYSTAKRLVPPELRPKVRRIWDGISKLLYYGTLNMFLAVEVEVNSACNLNTCWYCPNSHFSRGDHLMDREVFNRIVSGLKGIGRNGYRGRFSPHFFGEPLLREDLPDLMYYVRTELPGVRIVIYTNGTELTTELYHNLIESGVDGFIVTQHSEAMLPNIECLFRELGPEDLRRIRYGTLDDGNLYNRGDLVQIPPERMGIPNPCFFAPSIMTITHPGDVILCCNDYFGEDVFGNVMKNSVTDIWNHGSLDTGERYGQIRREVRGGTFRLPICRRCVGISRPVARMRPLGVAKG